MCALIKFKMYMFYIILLLIKTNGYNQKLKLFIGTCIDCYIHQKYIVFFFMSHCFIHKVNSDDVTTQIRIGKR